jgi:hypothetical protein
MRRLCLVPLLLTAISAPAWAQDPPPADAGACAAPVMSDKLLGDMSTVEAFLRNGDNDAAAKATKDLRGDLDCLGEVLPTPMIYSRVYRAIGAGLYVGGDLQGAQDWFATAVSVEPTYQYGTEDLPPNHPALSVYQEQARLGTDPPAPVEGKTFGEGDHYVDGKKVSAPAAVPMLPHLVQLKAADGTAQSWVIVGNDFPDAAMGSAAVAAVDENGKTPKEPKPPKEPKAGDTVVTDPDAVTTIGRNRPIEKTPLMIGGALIVAGAGGIYYLAYDSRSAFDDAKLKPDVDTFRKKTNTLFVISCATLAVGAGTATWGIVVADGTVLPAVSLRF